MGIVPAAELEASSAPFALVAAEIFGPWAAIAIAAAAALKATGTLGGWMLVTGETGARAAHNGYLPAIFGRLNGRGAAAWGLLIVASAMSVIAFITLSPQVSEQFGTIINIVVNLVVLAYARSEEHTSELQSLMRISYAVFCLKKQIYRSHNNYMIR